MARKIALSGGDERAQGQETEAGKAVAAKSRIEDGRHGRTVGRSEKSKSCECRGRGQCIRAGPDLKRTIG